MHFIILGNKADMYKKPTDVKIFYNINYQYYYKWLGNSKLNFVTLSQRKWKYTVIT